MNEDVKEEITIILGLLKGVLVKNKCSMATDNTGKIIIFSTDEYLQKKEISKCSGMVVDIKDLVR